jgi:hypothetical protein
VPRALPLLLLALLLAGCGAEAAERPATERTDSGLEKGRNPKKDWTPLRSDPPSKLGRWQLARVLKRTQLRSRPGGKALRVLKTRTEFGSPRILSVLDERDGWLRVLVPELANHKSGWVPKANTRAGATNWSVEIDRSARRLRLRHGTRTIRAFPVAIGRPAYPTPLGRFAVTDRLTPKDPSSPYGCCAIALTGHQTKLVPGWVGGDRLAIHNTPQEETVGQAASLGCLRGRRAHLRVLMRRLPIGAPVFIRA